VSAEVPAISVEELAAGLQSARPPIVVDVREPWERAVCRLPDTLDLPLARLPTAVDRLPADRELVILCHHGVRSAMAVAWLRRQGFDRAINLAGGIDAWAQRIDPQMRRY
jgi:rhodanese-related sulfurtransferase